MAVAELAQPLFGLKRGRRSFTRAAAMIHHPGERRTARHERQVAKAFGLDAHPGVRRHLR